MMSIMDDEMDIDMAQSKEDKDIAFQSKASKTWRVLRLSSRNKLAAFDRIDDGKNLKVLFETPSPAATASAEQSQLTDKAAPGTTTTTTQPLPSAESQAPTDEETTKEDGASEQDHESSNSHVEKGDAAISAPEHTSAESQHPEEALATAENGAS